ncbi:MAG: hypothetical protein IBJ01_08095 [Leptospira sp.]|uniref:hypothetical protein n=1 Tax=Leptospira sp. TaxID=178 RepID=UPI0025BEF8BD|nr:hypothetical protein [Leptospira sp.]MBL0954711.1 hypothetical protein [Leptospira sp.]
MLLQDQVSVQAKAKFKFYPTSIVGLFYYFRYRIYCLKSSYLRSFRRAKEQFNYFLFKGHVNLGDFSYDPSLGKPRGKSIDEKYFSFGYQLEFKDLPPNLLEYIKNLETVIEHYFGCEALVSKPNLWRNFHIDEKHYGKDIFSECFHQDLVRDHLNMQLFILLHDTNEELGPFEFLPYEEQLNHFDYYRKRNRIKPKSNSITLTGKRGDTLLISTGYVVHKAGNPMPGKHRDMLSLAFFPKYTGIGESFSNL